ncbi:protein ENL [Platysternon megacephalum]|uniref:Protein ENL n=1 Tax=Platysternon megacephalum TaxID=55544 RepID=A0A4D9DXN3_9SAUR|nr:protein ENL [Platysternon megacephalum]
MLLGRSACLQLDLIWPRYPEFCMSVPPFHSIPGDPGNPGGDGLYEREPCFAVTPSCVCSSLDPILTCRLTASRAMPVAHDLALALARLDRPWELRGTPTYCSWLHQGVLSC